MNQLQRLNNLPQAEAELSKWIITFYCPIKRTN